MILLLIIANIIKILAIRFVPYYLRDILLSHIAEVSGARSLLSGGKIEIQVKIKLDFLRRAREMKSVVIISRAWELFRPSVVRVIRV